MRAPRLLSGPAALLIALWLVVVPGPAPAEQAGSPVHRVAVASLDAGGFHTCAVLLDSRVRCWGSNVGGQLGQPDVDGRLGDDEVPSSLPPVPVGGKVAAVSAGLHHTCALLVRGSVRCWGSGNGGVLGYGPALPDGANVGDDETPASVGDVPIGGPAIGITAGAEHTCALMRTGAVRCWGQNDDGKLGHPADVDNVGDDETPASVGDVPLGGRAVAVTAGGDHTCALMTTGAVRCWGLSTNGRLGYGLQPVQPDPTPAERGDVPLGGTAVAISAGTSHTCALLDTGGVRCWGAGANGRLGYASTEDVGDDETPAARGDVDVSPARTLTAGHAVTCVVLETGPLSCWGRNDDRALGLPDAVGDVGDDETPQDAGIVPDMPVSLAVGAGLRHTCSLAYTNAVICWGRGAEGQRGYGSTDSTAAGEAASASGAVPLGAEARGRAPTNLDLAVTPRRDRTAPYRLVATGRVTGAFRAPGDLSVCSGPVTVVARTPKTRVRREVALGPDCRFRAVVRLRPGQVGPRPARVRFKATYSGSTNLLGSEDRARARVG